MVTSEDVIKEYCKLQHLKLISVSGCDRFVVQDAILYLTDNIESIYFKMAKIDLRYVTKVKRVVKIRLKTDMTCDAKLLAKGTELIIVHFEKNAPITALKKKYLNEYLNFINDTFEEKLSTELIAKNPMPKLIGYIKKSRNKIFWQELTTQLVPIINELKIYNIDITLTIDKLALRDNKYVWNWIDLK